MVDNNKRRIVTGLFWSYAERIAAQLISLIVSIILARLLDPEHYGVISIVLIFITFCDAFVTGGFGNSIVQKKDPDELDYNSMLICSISISLILFCLIWIIAPYIADFYETPVLKWTMRVLGIRIPISGINSIQQAIIQKKMQFRKFFFATIIGTLLSAVVGITMAYKGFGVWSLVAQYLTNSFVDTLVLFFTSGWKPKLQFSIKRVKQLLEYGWKVLLTTLVYTIQGELRSLIIGKEFGASDLAFYDQGRKFPNLVVSNINTSISKVMFPALSSVQNDIVRLKNMCRKSSMVGIFLLSPLLFGLIAIAEDFVIVLLTDKWLPCVPFLRITTLIFLVRPFTTICQQGIMAVGRSDITLKIEIAINVVGLALIVIATFGFHSVLLIAWAGVFTEVISLAFFMFYSKKILGYKVMEQISDNAISLLSAGLMAIVVKAVGSILPTSILGLISQIVIGMFIYCMISIFAKNQSLRYLVEIINKK